MDDRVFARLRAQAAARVSGADPAHDFSHVMRVVNLASIISRAEGADHDITSTAALLHEVVNLPKSDPQSVSSGDLCADAVATLLDQEGVEADFAAAVCDCIRTHAFSAGRTPTSLEARVVRDADRLDAIGAIGVARCFATCATMRRPFYADEDPFCEHQPPEDKRWGLDHFYRKLLRIPSLLHTASAKELAVERAAFLAKFIEQLRCEIAV